MSTRYSELAIALRLALATELASLTQLVIERRVKPKLDRTEFDQSKIYIGVYVGDTGWERLARRVDKHSWSILLSIQAALPDPPVASGSNPFGVVTSQASDPVAWSDTVFENVERIKDLWRPESEDGSRPSGPLRDRALAGCEFQQLLHDPIYIAQDLMELGILTSVISLTYVVVQED